MHTDRSHRKQATTPLRW